MRVCTAAQATPGPLNKICLTDLKKEFNSYMDYKGLEQNPIIFLRFSLLSDLIHDGCLCVAGSQNSYYSQRSQDSQN